jgi:murein DD-endopeptidase MepM/ murein hydrolase activator NlpD
VDRRAGFGGLLVVLAVVMAFGVGGRIGSAADDGAMRVSRATSGPMMASVDPSAAARSDREDGASAYGISVEALPIHRTSTDRSTLASVGNAAGRTAHTSAVGRSARDRARDAAVDGAAGGAQVRDLTIVTRGVIQRGESLGAALRRQGISPGTVHLIATQMRKVFDFRRSRPGDRYRLGQDADRRVLDFRYAQSEEESFYMAWDGARYVVRRETAELHPLIAKIAGVVDSSFYGAIVSLGEQSALASEFARILAWDIDFGRQVHPGDEFQILYERLYRTNDDGEDVYVRPGRILAGRYVGRSGDHTVVYFEDEDGEGAYFRPDGSSVERAFLAAPLEFSRISSRFTRARLHPILNVTRPHPGIDYAAPHGTPVWAVADGVVEYRARAGASGNLIRIRHQGGLTSHYAHLQSFAEGLNVGDRVEQKQVIGYVGSTGLSTGPHVCFRVKRDGTYVDPMKISGPAGAPVAAAKLPAFRSVRDRLLADLGAGPIAMADEAL